MVAKTAVLVGIISMIMMQSVSGAPKINYNQDHVENTTEKHTEQASVRGFLKIRGHASYLADLDGWTAGNSDPYMEVVAEDVEGRKHSKRTPVRDGTNNPDWDDYLFFLYNTWNKVTVSILDYDGHDRKPDPLCPTKELNLEGKRKQEVIIYCIEGFAVVEFEII